MITTHAACYLDLGGSGSTDTTASTECIDHFVKCEHCDTLYRLKYAKAEIERIENYENRLLREAQKRVNANHPRDGSVVEHATIISILEIS